MNVLETLEALAALLAIPERSTSDLYIRWSRDPEADLRSQHSTDELTGVELPGLSANPLAVEPWWQPRPLPMWVARRIYDYRHLAEVRGEGTRPWIVRGNEVGRGPDNEPLISNVELVAELDWSVVAQAVEMVESLPADWGSLRRA
jgi:hypothetical protein